MEGHFVGLIGSVTLSIIAFSVVFIVLAGLSLVMYGIKHIADVVERVSAKGKQTEQVRVDHKTPAVTPQQPRPTSSDLEEEVVAVITAAISAYLKKPFTILSVKPSVCGESLWKRVAKIESLEGLDDHLVNIKRDYLK